MQSADLDNRFGFHPANDTSRPRHERVRQLYRELAGEVDALAGPDSREKSLAITALEESMFWSNAAIARVQPLEEQ